MEMIVVATMLVVVVLLGVAVKLYDLKRKREDEAIAAQARISDALLMEATLAGLPLTLGEALAALEQSEPVATALGPEMTRLYTEFKRDEWARYCSAITDWEREMYREWLP